MAIRIEPLRFLLGQASGARVQRCRDFSFDATIGEK
jgi:hypothetical protein